MFRLSITAGTARFLVIRFEISGHLKVHHETDIGLVDSHAERVGGHHDPAVPSMNLAGFRCALSWQVSMIERHAVIRRPNAGPVLPPL